MKLRFALVPFLALRVLPAPAQDVPEVPSMLFDIELGGVYAYPSDGAEGKSVGAFPVKRLVSEQLSVHQGISLYFEPLTENAAFPFREIALDHSAYPITTHRVYVYPVLPQEVLTLEDLRESNLPQRVFMIEWSRGDGGGYTWALNVCKSIEEELGIEPEITDSVDRGIYGCAFSSGERELEVTSVVGQTIQLSFTDEITDQMDAEIHSRIRRLELEERRRRRPARPD